MLVPEYLSVFTQLYLRKWGQLLYQKLCNLSLEIQGPFMWEGVLLYLGMVGRFRSDDPRDPIWSLLYGAARSDWPLFLQKKSICVLSHLVPEIHGHKVLRILYQFFPFCINFRLDFRSNWPPFSLVLDLIDLSFLQNFRSDWVHFIYRVPNLPTENLVKYHPTPGLSLIVLCMHIYLTIGNHSQHIANI